MPKIKMNFQKEHRSVVQYEAEETPGDPKLFLQTVYIRKHIFTPPFPTTINLLLEY